LQKKHDLAVAEKKPVLIDTLLLDGEEIFPYLDQQPAVWQPPEKDLPENLMTDEELKAKGITIINPPNERVKLQIRETAFAQDGIFAGKEVLSPELEIYLVDAPSV
jgi:hypothetical protein